MSTLSVVIICFTVILAIYLFLSFKSKSGKGNTEDRDSMLNEKIESMAVENVTSADVLDVVDEKIFQIDFSNTDGSGVVVKRFDGEIGSGLLSLDLERSGISRSAPFLQQLPGALLADEAASTKYMEVIVKGDLSLAAGSTNTYRPVVHGENGKIIEQAKLKDPKQLQNIAKFNMAFQLASVVVAQKHLADISKSLDELKEGVNDIRAFQENERYSKIFGKIEYLCQVEKSIRNGELDSSVRTKFEDIELELLEIQNHLNIDIDKLLQSIITLEDKDSFGSEDTFKALKDLQIKLEDLLKAWSESVLTRTYACTLLSAYPGNKILVDTRVASIKESVNTMANVILNNCASVTKERVNKIKSLFNISSTLVDRKKDVEKYIESNTLKFEKRQDCINKQLLKIDGIYLDQKNSNGLRFAMGLKNGQIDQAYVLN